jgi:molybdopterin synthase catalytic subunit
MIEQWIKEIKGCSDFQDLGMFLIHNGVVRATSKDGKPVKGMQLSYDKKKLADLVDEMGRRDGIVSVNVWINEGLLHVGDDIMYALVAGKFRTHVFPVLEELVSRIKKEVVLEMENF